MNKQMVAEKLAIIMYRDNYLLKVDPILKYLTDINSVKIDRYIYKLYMDNNLYPYSTRELIYSDDIPDGIDGSVSKEDIMRRMMSLVNTDIGDVMPANGRVLPFHPYIAGYDIYTPLYLPGFKELKSMMDNITPGDGYIIVVGDYDVDGVTSQAIVINCLTAMGHNIKSIPNERVNGNGYNGTAHDQVKDLISTVHGCKALIMTDHGSGLGDIPRLAEINNDYKVPVAVLDHHKVMGPTNEVVTTFINSRESEYQELCAGALAWQAMLYIGAPKSMLDDMLPYAAITLITDVMDTSIWYTYAMYRHGIKMGRDKPNAILNMFMKSLRGNNILSEDIIGFNIGPILNSGHRMNNAKKSVELLTAPATLLTYKRELERDGVTGEDFETRYVNAVVREVHGNYKDLVSLNKMRKMKSSRGVEAGHLQYVEYKKHYKYGAVLVLDRVDENVIGIISSSIGNAYKEPTITLIKGKKWYVGSGRSIIRGLDCEAICSNIRKEHPDVVLDGGGHPEAFGVKVALDKVEEFKRLFSEGLAEHAHTSGVLVGEEVPYTPYPVGVPKKQILQDLLNHEPYGKLDKPHYSVMGELKIEIFGITREHMKVTVGNEVAIFFNGVKEYKEGTEYIGMVVSVSPDTFKGGVQIVVSKLIEEKR